MLETAIREFAIGVYVASFAILSWRSFVHWRRRDDPSARWFSIAFGSLGIVVVGGLASQVAWGDDPPAFVSALLVAVLCVFSPAIMCFVTAFGQLARIECTAAIVAFAALGIAGFGIDYPPPGTSGDGTFTVFSILFVAAWLLTSIRVVSSLWLASSARPGIIRGRMRLLAAGFALLDVALVLQSFDVNRNAPLLIACIAALSSVVTLAGFAPPEWLRLVLRQPEQQRLRSMIATLVSATSTEEVLERLLPATRDVLGAAAIAVLHGDELTPLASGYDPETLEQIRESLSTVRMRNGQATVVDGRLVVREAELWSIVDRPRDGEFFGADELDVLASITSIAAITVSRIQEAESVREHERRLQTAVDIAGIGKWEWRIATDSLHWSPRMREIFGLGPDDGPVTYERYQSMLRPEDRDRMQELVARALETGEPYEIDHEIVLPDGSTSILHSSARVVAGADGEPERLTGITVDITSRKRAEDALRAEVEVERAAADRLREIDELRNNILAAVSHELRTPLTAVHGFAILLQDRFDEMEPDQRREIIDHLAAESERLRRLFADLLDIDRFRRGRTCADREPTDIMALVRDVVDRSPIADRIMLDLEPIVFPVDAPKVERILENLIGNAEKYAGSSPVRVRAHVVGDQLELRVEDDGPGIDLEQREQVFEPFNRGDAELGHAPGTGIGLALVAQFAQMHGGSAHVDSTPSGGAAFIVRFAPGDGGSDDDRRETVGARSSRASA
ncbi:MAG: PAS domain-containing protein [Thermoleophilia bacterium]|nr:PAS domain-containing protein [Thermoleophilia bacterium]